MIERVMGAPVNLFFDVTPIGKILNRFSRDMQMLDENINYDLGSFGVFLYNMICCLFVAAYAVHYILVVELIFVIWASYYFKKTLPAYKECFRINMIQFSPIISYF
jgi:ABC-type multidrug transport system fused ATPase/permease subunit